MEIPDQLRCLFSAQVTEADGTYRLEIPDQEVQLGELSEGETYRVALLDAASDTGDGRATTEPAREGDHPEPPVEEGETLTVDIEDIGDQGDGITRVERGFVVIVPDTEQGERVRIEITDVQQTVAFADVVERLSYYE
ncbi:TRAM domain-containing protein [Haloglomus salinum]|jgi:predicted RNA-binding protein with TRAM domain|uniref:TRAM domain-containing protein n=1 Tax=Haloglomus salinum TaxID=2962673 RepID=UPI0020C9BFCC|nr:TRAM domain-containing protein [Haloglomus salinum]